MGIDQQGPGGGKNMLLPSMGELLAFQGRELVLRLGQLGAGRAGKSQARTLRSFSLGEAAAYLGLSPSNLKKLHLEGKGPLPSVLPNGRRVYSSAAIADMRLYLDRHGRTGTKQYLPYRRRQEPLQIMALVNFRLGSGKTTIAAHLAQYLALTGHRVLAVDLDPQAHLSALLGFDGLVHENGSICQALRTGPDQQALTSLIKPTHFHGLDVVPASIELETFAQQAMPPAGPDAPGASHCHGLCQVFAQADASHDIVIIDTPPQLGPLMLAAICAATGVLVAVHPQVDDLTSTSRFLVALGQTLSALPQTAPECPSKWVRYLVTRYDGDDLSHARHFGMLQSVLAAQMITRPLLDSPAIASAMASRRTLYEVERTGPDRFEQERALRSLDGVNGEIRDFIHAQWGRNGAVLQNPRFPPSPHL